MPPCLFNSIPNKDRKSNAGQKPRASGFFLGGQCGRLRVLGDIAAILLVGFIDKIEGAMVMTDQVNREFEIDIQDLLSHFDSLEDPRSEVNLRHLFVSVITISIMAIFTGISDCTLGG